MRLSPGLFAVSLLATAAASTAGAQVTGVVVSRNVSVTGFQPGAPTNQFNIYNREVGNESVQFNLPNYYVTSQQNYQVSTNIDNAAGHIEFANNATTAGFSSYVTATTTITVNYMNSTDHSVNATLLSEITPAGLGFYQSDPTGNYEAPGDINHNPESASFDMGYGPGYATQPREDLGVVSVNFQILSGSATVADYFAQLVLFREGGDTDAGPGSPQTELLQQSSTGLTLNNFGLIAADDPLRAVGYRWDATQVLLNLGEIGAGESRSLTYITSVNAYTALQNFGPTDALIGYAGFGDPIGANAGGGGIADPLFNLINLSVPTFDPVTGQLAAAQFQGYQAAPLALQQRVGSADLPVDPVPEPGTWALLIAGFGLAGTALRRRPRLLLA